MKKKIVLSLLFALVAVFFVCELVSVWSFGVDDSYIFYRYSERVFSSEPFTFNPGEIPGEGFTSWLWTLLLACGHLFGLNVLFFSKVLGTVFHVSGAFMVFVAAQRLQKPSEFREYLSFLLSSAFLLNYELIAHSVSGMETPMYIAALIAVAVVGVRFFHDRELKASRIVALGLFAFTMHLIRPEGVLWPLFLALLYSFQRIRKANKPLPLLLKFMVSLGFSFLLPLFLFILFKCAYFGYPLPHAFYHKYIVINKEYLHSLKHLGRFAKAYGVYLVAAALSVLLFVRRVEGRFSYLYMSGGILVLILMYIKFYPAMNYMHRFYIPFIPYLLLLCIPFLTFGFSLVSRWKHFNRGMGLLFVLVFSIFYGVIWVGRSSAGHVVENWSKMVSPKMYRGRLGMIMNDLPADTVVACTEMGVIPYFSKRTCIDMAGLTDPEVVHEGLMPDFLERRKVDFIVFPWDVHALGQKRWDAFTHNFKNVFLSGAFEKNYAFLGAYPAFPDRSRKYYLYYNKTSTNASAFEKWRDHYAAELQ